MGHGNVSNFSAIPLGLPEFRCIYNFTIGQAIRLKWARWLREYHLNGHSWIMSQQESDGTWNNYFQFPFLTTLIIEYFREKPQPLSKLGTYLSIARDFILRSQEFVLEDNENARRLAIVIAFQGIEALLYACLSNPSVNVKIFDKPDKTIGMRDALTRLQTYLQASEAIRQGQPIEYRNELDKLAYIR